MPKMESTSDIPGGPNLMCCCVRLPTFRWRPGLDWKDILVAIQADAARLVPLPQLGMLQRKQGSQEKIAA